MEAIEEDILFIAFQLDFQKLLILPLSVLYCWKTSYRYHKIYRTPSDLFFNQKQ